jgi:hypothetical protein
VGKSSRLRKETDYETQFWCAGGIGILREEVWVDETDEVVRYNLAFLLRHCSGVDNGRILGYDNAHGVHERHFMGKADIAEFAEFEDYVMTARRFYREAEALRSSYENEDIRRRI